MANDSEPYIPPTRSLPEFTAQAVALGLLLSVILCAANVYVGLYAGMTVSAAIPASVISMGVLRGLLRRGTILENNVVHTIASSGESLAAGIIFTVPAIVLLGIWTDFNYWETTLIAMAGGLLGVVMMIPLRRPMIIEQKELRYPEGVACAEVLKAGDRGGAEMAGIFSAMAIGGVFKALIAVVGLFRDKFERAWQVGPTGFSIGADVSPMLMGVGFIVGWEIAVQIFLGGAISFVGAMPVLAWGVDLGENPAEALDGIWDEQIRYFGIGGMVIAGVYSIVKIARSIGAAIGTAVRGVRGLEDTSSLPRTEQGITGRALFALMIVSLVLSGVVYYVMTGSGVTTAVTTAAMFVLAFLFVAVASYIVGLVGSSNSPVSGMTICTVLVTAGLLLVLGYSGEAGMLATLGVAGVVCCAACTSGDICQDLKIGQIVGATPRRLQMGEVIGTVVAALIIAPVLQLLHHAYGIGEAAQEGVAALKAPQAVMFQKLVGGIFGAPEAVRWDLVGYGAAVGAGIILVDHLFLATRKGSFRLYAMPVAVGMYLPWSVTFPILLGGMAYLFVNRRFTVRRASDAVRQAGIHRGLLFASGLVAGEAIMGILVAMLLAVYGWSGRARFDPYLRGWAAEWVVELVSLAAFGAVIWLLVRKALRSRDAG